jgi:hypothetical protein
MAFGDKSQWDYLAMALIKEYRALQNASAPQERGKTYFQFAGQPLQADWTSGTDYPAWTRANIVPGDLDGFYRETTSLVARSYSTYISSIAPTGFQTNPQYQGYQTNLSALESDYATLAGQAMDAFIQWKNRYPEIAGNTTYFQWLTTEGTEGPSWNAQIQNNQEQQNNVKKTIADFVKAVDTDLGSAQQAVTEPANMESFTIGGVTQTELLTTIEDLSTILTKWTSKSEGAYELDITIDQETLETGEWQESIQSSVKQNCCSISSSVTIDWKRVIQDTKYKLQVQAIGANNFLIGRGKWYNADWLMASKVEFPQGSRFTMKDFFGEEGTLHMVPVSVFVIYKPKVTLTISTETYTETVKSYYDASASVSIFGLNFSLAGGEEKFVQDGPNDTKIITFDSFSDPTATPLVFGMSSQAFYPPPAPAS